MIYLVLLVCLAWFVGWAWVRAGALEDRERAFRHEIARREAERLLAEKRLSLLARKRAREIN